MGLPPIGEVFFTAFDVGGGDPIGSRGSPWILSPWMVWGTLGARTRAFAPVEAGSKAEGFTTAATTLVGLDSLLEDLSFVKTMFSIAV